WVEHLPESESTQYQLLYSRGTGVIHVVGIVPQSHLNVLTLSVEDGEITKQVVGPKCWI
ncbi:EMC1 protein, partial [Orthonyx spaldingii]|nr:EMC1 protein [Orthonyx spaldingii]